MESGRQRLLANLVLGAGIVVYGTSSVVSDGLGIWTGVFLACGFGLLINNVRRPGDAPADVTERDARIVTGCAALFVLAAVVLLL
jgi:hypothetical protein